MEMTAKIGKQNNAAGALSTARAAREGELITTQNHGDFYQKLAEGDGFSIGTLLAGLTLAATHTTATLTAAATPVITLFNAGTMNIAVNRLFVGTLSGTPGAGTWWWYKANGQSASALTLLTDANANSVNAKTLTSDAPSGLKIGVGKALTGLIGGLELYKPAGNLGAITAGLGFFDANVNGNLIIAPGQMICLMAPAIGTTHIVHASLDITKAEVSA